MAPLDKRFDHETYTRNIFATREELGSMAKILLDTKATIPSLIINLARIAGINIIFSIRKAMLEEEMLLEKQIYKQKRRQQVGDGLADDSLD